MHILKSLAIAGMIAGIAVSVAAGPAASTPQRTPAPAPAEPWFDGVTAPADIPYSVWEKAVREIHGALKAGSVPATFLDFLPPSPIPRVVFITCAAPERRARTQFAAGNGVREAATAAVTRALAEGEPFRHASWVKIDSVQQALWTADFQTRNTLLVQPTLVGLAFSKGSGFALLPEQMAQGGLVSDVRLLDTDRAAELLLTGSEATKRMGDWTLVASYGGPQVVTFFECLSFYSAGDTVQVLFRGHPLARRVTPEALQTAVAQSAAFLVSVQSKTGEFTQPAGRWQVGGPATHEALADQAGAVCALFEAQDLLGGQPKLAAAAEKGCDWLLTNLQPFKLDPKAACLTDGGRVTLADNALGVLALVRYEKITGKSTHRDSLQKLGAYLLGQVQPDKSFIGERLFPSGNIKAPAVVTDSAQAIIALIRLYEMTREPVYLDTAQQALANAVNTWVTSREMDKLPQEPWLLLAINEIFSYTHDNYLGREVERLVLAMETAQPLDVPFPDFLGGFKKSSAVTGMALQSAGLLAAAEFLRDNRRPVAADKTLGLAHFALMFQLQAQADTVSVAFFTDPARWYGAFREDLVDYRFTLAGQCRNLQALVFAGNSMKRQNLKALPLAKPQEKALEAVRTQVLTFPRCLPKQLPPLPVLKENPADINPVNTSGQSLRHKPVEVKIAAPEDMYPQPVIIQKKPAKK